jgi:hypothetical protein
MAAPSKVARKTRIVGVDPQDFSPSLLRVQNQPPAPFARAMLHTLLTPSILEKCKKHNAMLTPLTPINEANGSSNN